MMNMNPRIRYAAIALAAAGLVGSSFVAGVAYAADARFDQSIDLITKAKALTESIESPGPKKFGGHREKAVDHMKDAIKQLEKAKEFQDKHYPPRPVPPTP